MAEKRRFIFGAAAAAMSVAAGAGLGVATVVAVVATLAAFLLTRRYKINASNVGLVVVTVLVVTTLLERVAEEAGFPLPSHLAGQATAWVLFGHECGVRYNPLITPPSR